MDAGTNGTVWYKLEFSFVMNGRRVSQKSGMRQENRNAPGDIYDFEFSLVGKIWDARETVKSQTIWDFPDI